MTSDGEFALQGSTLGTASIGETDEALAVRGAAGSIASVEELVRRYQVPLLRFLQTRCHDRHAAEDAVQESFLRMYRALDRFDANASFKTWLYTIAHRCLIDASRKRTIKPGGEEMILADPRQSDPKATALKNDEQQRLWEIARRSLPPQQFTAVWLFYVEDLNAAEIAVITGRSWVWVRTALVRARRTLEVHLRPLVENVA